MTEIIFLQQKIKLDKAQIPILESLQDLAHQINSIKFLYNSSLWCRILFFFKKKFYKQNVTHLYIYGNVGRGKSMLAHYFLNELLKDISSGNKLYIHFNNFMQQIHRQMHFLRKKNKKTSNNLVYLAIPAIIKQAKIIVFDEMQVEDIADAMIIKDVINYFIQEKINIIATSNYHPLELYENGLQRELFLQFVKQIILNDFLILNLDGKNDYRAKIIKEKKHYFYPINHSNRQEVNRMWKQLVAEDETKIRELEVLGRKIIINKSCKNMAIFNFKDLCQSDWGVIDYQKICQEFSIIFLLNIPILQPEDRNEAQRLIWFVDEIYENKNQLIVLADCKPEEIYVKGVGSRAFKRTASRLKQI